MADYQLEFTDVNLPIINVNERVEISDLVDITLFGYLRLQYGRDLNENFVHLLEHFAAPEDSGNVGNPDLTRTITIEDDEDTGEPLLSTDRLLEGQVWYNTTQQRPFVWYDNEWHPIEVLGREVAANWGQIADGAQIPEPVSESGYVFDYSECSWIVSPFNQLDEIDEMECKTDDVANVTIQYLYSGDGSRTSGVANYMIVGLKDNNNLGVTLPPITPETPTPTPDTPTPTPDTPTPETPTPTPTPTDEPMSLVFQQDVTALCSTGNCIAYGQVFPGTTYVLTGGSGNYSYQWSNVSGVSITYNNASIANPELSRYGLAGNTYVGTGRLTVTDVDNPSDVVSDTFIFETTHFLVTTPEPEPDTPTPETLTPTPELGPGTETPPPPTPTPENLSIERIAGSLGGACNGCTLIDNAATFRVSGGVAPYNWVSAVITSCPELSPVITETDAGINGSSGDQAEIAFSARVNSGSDSGQAICEIDITVNDSSGRSLTQRVTGSATFGSTE